MLTVALPIALALIMITLGMSLTPSDFKRIFVQPRGVLIGLGNLFLISPFLAFAVAELYGLGGVFAVGLVLLGASPGGTTANLMTHLARGDTALSVSMTALSSIAAIVTVPLYLALAISHFDVGVEADVSMPGIVARVFAITVIPLAVGMWIRASKTEWSLANEAKMKRAALIAFLLVIAGAIAAEFDTAIDHIGELALAALTLNIAAMSVSFLISRAARLDSRQATAVALELGVHNGTLAIAVAALIADEYTIPAAIYSMFMFATASAFARVMYRRNEPATAAI